MLYLTHSFGLARYNADGSLDITFNPKGGGNVVPASNPPGTAITRLGPPLIGAQSVGQINSLVLQADDNSLKLVAAGFSETTTTNDNDFTLARYFLVDDISPLVSAVITKYCA